MFSPHGSRITGSGMQLVLNTVQTIPTQVQNLFVQENVLASHVEHHNGFKARSTLTNI
jgi:hypothetical protein